MSRDLSTRWYHPEAEVRELWPGPDGYPWKNTTAHQWTREGLLRRTGPQSLVATWTTGGFSEPALGNFTMMVTSDDMGATWQDAGRFEHPARGLFTTELFVPAEGEIHAFLQTYETGEWMSRLESCRAISRDHGRSWDTPHSIPGGIHNVWVNRGIVLSTGRWVIPCSWAEHVGTEWGRPSVGRSPAPCRIGTRLGEQKELMAGADLQAIYQEGNSWCHRNHRYACGVMLSGDGGETFEKRGYLRAGERGHLIEPRVVELSDGTLAMLIRSLDDSRLWKSRSTDQGNTWTPAEPSDIPNPSAKVNILRSRDGRIFLIHNPSGQPSGSGGFNMHARNPLSLWISNDDMRSWQVKVDLVRDTNPGAALNYPDGYIDEERGVIDFLWEDMFSVYRMIVPMDIRTSST